MNAAIGFVAGAAVMLAMSVGTAVEFDTRFKRTGRTIALAAAAVLAVMLWFTAVGVLL